MRNNEPLTDARQEALRRFTQLMVRGRGKVSDEISQEFFRAGWSRQQVLEVILAIAIKTMSNYTNAIAQVPLDEIVQTEA